MKKKKENEIVQLELELDDVVEEAAEEVVEEVDEDLPVEELVEEFVEELPIEEPVEEIQNGEENVEELPEVKGTVTAAKLNVRELPNKAADVVCVLNKDDVVTLVMNSPQTYEDFYEVVTTDGKLGFCMKQFIKLD